MKKFFLIAVLFSFIAVMGNHIAQAEPDGQDKVYQGTPEELEIVAVGNVTEIVKPDQIKLSNGKSYALDNIRIPVQLNQQIQDYLASTLIGKQVGIFVNPRLKNNHTDKLGNVLGEVVTENGLWVQADLVSKGYAWAFSSATSRDLVVPLYNYEDQARRSRLGLWRDRDNAVKYDKTIVGTEGSFQLYEGIVKAVHPNDDFSALYINFGKDPQTDFTILVKMPFMFSVPRDYFTSLPNERIRIRGWVENSSGPMIELTHPEQLELLGQIVVAAPAATCDPAVSECPPAPATTP